MPMLLAALILAAPVAQGGPALTPERADLRCLAALASITPGDSDQDRANGMQIGALYFAGKILGRNPGIDLTAALTSELAAVGSDKMLQGELQRCAAELQAAGDKLIATGSAMQGR
jgi:hypothetical protein